jgi:non-ribosomal peptide synthetase component F
VGLGIAGRTHPDIENMIGFFVNTLAIRNQPEENQSFEQFLNQVKQNTLQGYENQGYPFDELVNKLGIPSDLSRNPVFDVAFVVQNMDVGKIEIENLKVKPYRFNNNVSRFDLQLAAWEVEDNIALGLEYSTALFKSTTTQKFVERYVNILEQVIDNRKIRLKDIAIFHDLTVAKSNVLKEDTLEFEF